MILLSTPKALISNYRNVRKSDAINSTIKELETGLGDDSISLLESCHHALDKLNYTSQCQEFQSNEEFRIFDNYFDVKRVDGKPLETHINNGVECAIAFIDNVSHHGSSLNHHDYDELISKIISAVFIGEEYLNEDTKTVQEEV